MPEQQLFDIKTPDFFQSEAVAMRYLG